MDVAFSAYYFLFTNLNFLVLNFIYLFIDFWLRWVFIAACGLSLVAVSGLLIVVASLVAEHRL